MDIEKVIKDLAVRIQSDSEEWNTIELPVEQAEEILTLLREQETLEKRNEPIKPELIMTTNLGVPILRCSNCKKDIHQYWHPKFCGYCGQAVKWND